MVSYVDLNFDLEIYLAEQDEPLEPIPLLKGFTVTIVRESVLMDNILTLYDHLYYFFKKLFVNKLLIIICYFKG